MSNVTLYQVMLEALRTLFLMGVPVVIALSIAGTILGALQSATSVHEPALAYGAKLLTLVVLLYFFLPHVAESLLSLMRMVLHG